MIRTFVFSFAVIAIFTACESTDPVEYPVETECGGRYTSAQLTGWLATLTRELGGDSAISTLGMANSPCILVVIKTEAHQERISARIEQLGVPLNAVLIRVGVVVPLKHIQPLDRAEADINHSLRSKQYRSGESLGPRPAGVRL